MNKFKIGDLPIDIKTKLNSACVENAACHMPMLCYISPQIVEMVDNFDKKLLTNKADIWSCACVFFEVIMLSRMFNLNNNDINELFEEITNTDKNKEKPIQKIPDEYKMFNLVLER